MQLVQVFLPLKDNDKNQQPARLYSQTEQELVEKFGGLTAFVQAPAKGIWENQNNRLAIDDIIIFEIMVERQDSDWWKAYRQRLEARFRQERILIRAFNIEIL